MPEDKLISESIVKMVFDQLRDTLKQNTDGVIKMAEVVHDLTKTVSTKKDIEDEIYNIDVKLTAVNDRGHERKKEVITEINNAATGIKTQLAELSKNVSENTQTQNDLREKVTRMMWLMGLIMSIVTVAYFFVRASIDTQIQKSLDDAVQKIVTSRPYSEWPVNIPQPPIKGK